MTSLLVIYGLLAVELRNKVRVDKKSYIEQEDYSI